MGNIKTLVVVTHPDDEILWFSSILFRADPDVVCVTGGRDAADRLYRRKAFATTMKILGIERYTFLDFPDQDERLDLARLEAALEPFLIQQYEEIYTHGPYGEIFNHQHHQDVSYVVHKLFDTVYSVAWNAYPERIFQLSKEEFDLKKYLIGTVYAAEYALLQDAYKINAIEEFIRLSRESVEIYYWGIGNFGDHHELLGTKYEDFWGFGNSPYEIERHAAITALADKTNADRIIEYGACEGLLSDKLSRLAAVDCTEQAGVYQHKLHAKQYRVIDKPMSANYDLSVVAAFLEYLDEPQRLLAEIKSKYVIVDVILDSKLDQKLEGMMAGYRKVEEVLIQPRWEQMYRGNIKEKLPIYKLGSRCRLFKRIDQNSPLN